MDKTSAQQQTAVQNRILRIRDGAQAVLDRLQAGEKLSLILPQAKAVTDEYGSDIQSFWLELEIYGLRGGPLRTPPYKDPNQKAGGMLFVKLHSVGNVEELDSGPEEGFPPRDNVLYESISVLECGLEAWREHKTEMVSSVQSQQELLDLKVQSSANFERERVLNDVRAQVYDRIAGIGRWASTEIENVALLGPDYRIVLDSLDALKTGVRQELVAALENVTSPNPAAWSATALVCRNAVLALGRTLWPAQAESYESALAEKKLDLKGEREVNRLSAWIDHHWRVADEEKKTRLESLDALARSIYKRGSKGKRQGQVRHEEGQKLVVDTFELVANLDRLVGLQPVVTP